MNNAATYPNQNYDALHMEGRHRAQRDFQDVSAFENPYTRHTAEWQGYHFIESKHLREALDNNQREPY